MKKLLKTWHDFEVQVAGETIKLRLRSPRVGDCPDFLRKVDEYEQALNRAAWAFIEARRAKIPAPLPELGDATVAKKDEAPPLLSAEESAAIVAKHPALSDPFHVIQGNRDDVRTLFEACVRPGEELEDEDGPIATGAEVLDRALNLLGVLRVVQRLSQLSSLTVLEGKVSSSPSTSSMAPTPTPGSGDSDATSTGPEGGIAP
jgi:hypothetical protein